MDSVPASVIDALRVAGESPGGRFCMFSWALYSSFVGEQRCGGWRNQVGQ